MKDVICAALGLGGGLHNRALVGLERIQPAFQICGVILQRRIVDSGRGAQKRRSEFANQLLAAVTLRTEVNRFGDAGPREPRYSTAGGLGISAMMRSASAIGSMARVSTWKRSRTVSGNSTCSTFHTR